MTKFDPSDLVGKFGKFKSFSATAFKSGGWKAVMKFDRGEDQADATLAFSYKPTAGKKNFVLSIFDQEVKATAKTDGDKLIVDIKIPMILSMMATAAGIPLKSDIHIEMDADMVSVGEKSITLKGSYDNEPWSVTIGTDRTDSETEEGVWRRVTTFDVSGNLGDQTFSAKARSINEYELGEDTLELIEEIQGSREAKFRSDVKDAFGNLFGDAD